MIHKCQVTVTKDRIEIKGYEADDVILLMPIARREQERLREEWRWDMEHEKSS